MKKKWVCLDEMPPEARPLLAAYNDVFGLHHTNNVVRSALGGPNPVVIIQRYGRVTAGYLRCLEDWGDCQVEIEARAPGYLLIMLFGYLKPSSPVPVYKTDTDGTKTRFLFKEFG